MLKEVFLFLVVVTAVSFGQAFDDVSRNQGVADYNEYYVYTQEFRDAPVKLTENNLEILHNRITLVVIHGHGGSWRHQMNDEIAKAILHQAQEDVNVLVVDWSVQAAQSYSIAEAAVPFVGTHLGDYLSTLALVAITPDRMHIVGFNLGAHIAGWAGRTLRNRGTPVARITGLDPSQCINRLTSTDADYVEIIHTDGGLLGNGLGEPGLGDVDFFVNGGSSQPDCLLPPCGHNRVWQLFAASLGWNTFLGRCCNSMSQMILNICRGSSLEMGNNQLLKNFGNCTIYRVNTRSTFPY